MYCPQCGSPNDDSARFCMACGIDMAPYRQGAPPPPARPHQNAVQAPSTPYQDPRPHPPTPYAGAMPVSGFAPVRVKSYLGWAIATLILCFWPTGIVAVVHATRVGNRLAAGDLAGAQESSRKAKWWSQLSFNIAVAFVIIAVFTTFVGRY